MSAANARMTRRIVKKQKAVLMRDAIREIMSADFATRIRFCWVVIKGVKKCQKK
jgi:hypothetical protein